MCGRFEAMEGLAMTRTPCSALLAMPAAKAQYISCCSYFGIPTLPRLTFHVRPPRLARKSLAEFCFWQGLRGA